MDGQLCGARHCAGLLSCGTAASGETADVEDCRILHKTCKDNNVKYKDANCVECLNDM